MQKRQVDSSEGGTKSDSPEAQLLRRIVSAESQDGGVEELISKLRGAEYTLADLFRDAASLKRSIAALKGPWSLVFDRWTRLDRMVSECVVRTSAAHESFMDRTAHAFCEIDRQGVIVTANAAMRKFDPDSIGKPLASYFGDDAESVRNSIENSSRQLFQLTFNGVQKYPVLAEFGRFETGGRSSGYALLVDMTDLFNADRKTLEAAPTGMVKLDIRQRIIHANAAALRLLEVTENEAIGRDARTFITDAKSRRTVDRQTAIRRKGRGGVYEALFRTAKSGKEVKLRLTSTPMFDSTGVFSGSLISLQPIDYELAQEDIARLLGTETDVQKLFSGLIEIVRRFVEFEWADLVTFTPNRDYSHSFCQYPAAGRPAYHSRWFPIPMEYRSWVEMPKSWIRDYEKFLLSSESGRLLLGTNRDVQDAIAAGLKAIITVPVLSGGQVLGVLSLQSNQIGKYDAVTKRTLRRLGLDQALQAIFRERERTEERFYSSFLKKIWASTSHSELAQTIVDGIAEHYNFQTVSIFRVNAIRQHFEPLAEASRGPQRRTSPPDYKQPLNMGLKGLAYQRKNGAILQDPGDGSEEASAFVTARKALGVTDATKSELCMPIRARGRALWMLSIADDRTHAFTDSDYTAINKLIEQIEPAIECLFQDLVRRQLVDAFPEAVVVATIEGNILRCNEKAARMFERESLEGGALSEFLLDAEGRAAFKERRSAPTLTTIVGARQKTTTVWMSVFTLPEEFDHIVVRLQDMTKLQWETDLERLKAALAEATSQVRVPLSLVSSFVQQLEQRATDSSLVDLARKSVRQLGRIELTYDRVMASYGNKLPGKSGKAEVSRILSYLIGQLPELSRKDIKLSGSKRERWVSADEYRLAFALESMLAYLLRAHCGSNLITITVSDVGDSVQVAMSGSVQRVEANGELAILVEAARTDIALGDDALNRIAADYKGAFTRSRRPQDREELSIRLPSASTERFSL
ncbi:PAS domain S-box protein [Mesorhizobium sp. MSK_1335]|uniref:PAS domain S-box protein n=1 Tax=Mesorhizobium montanum TaxID=3072323 RepID=A0ABU4ZPS8_9HYPH|nr:PAS domain-containing protein [Mesorhizobium sp. MSK_1335]MDX8527005.1 PAS domain S-box protein [Mesorhizobium sp. MSK_1335]